MCFRVPLSASCAPFRTCEALSSRRVRVSLSLFLKSNRFFFFLKFELFFPLNPNTRKTLKLTIRIHIHEREREREREDDARLRALPLRRLFFDDDDDDEEE
jgi:hypothetical protein